MSQMQDSRRKIVIDLSPGQGVRKAHARATGRRWPKILMGLGVFVVIAAVLLLAGAVVWWQYYKTKPAYALAVVVDAVRRNDPASLNEVLDNEKVVSNLVTQVTETASARYGGVPTLVNRQRIESLIPGLLPRVRQNIQGELSRPLQRMAEKAGNKPFFLVAVTIPYILDINTNGDASTVSFKDGNKVTQLTMERVAAQWKITAIKDDEVVQRIADKILQELPTVGQPLTEPLGRDLSPKPRSRSRRNR
jgi:hypothetical protein